MSASSIGEKKRALRLAAQSRRSSLASEYFHSLGSSVQLRALEFAPYLAARAVILYSPIQNEVPTERLRDHAWANGKSVFYPRLAGANRLEVAEVSCAADLAVGRLGISEPTGTAPRLNAAHEAMVLFVPGLLFDGRGHRLGRGLGWYDRLLSRFARGAVFAALAYEFQIVEEVPTEPWDENVHYVITEKRVIDCGATALQPNAVS